MSEKASITQSEIHFKMFQLSKSLFVKVVIYLMIFSYFMNLPVLFYSIKGENEFRIYDLLGPFLFYIFYQEKVFFRFIIKNHMIYRRLYYFSFWGSLSLLVTLFFAAYYEKLVWFLQCVLYVYHLWEFLFASVLLFCMSKNITFIKNFLYFYFGLSIVMCLIVILQNFGLIPFLWSKEYDNAYEGFLSGTLAPNKIVLGISCLINFVLSLAFLFERRISLPKAIVVFSMVFNLICILLSGSRTSYLGLLVFLSFLLFKDTRKFMIFGVFIVFGSIIFYSTDNPIKDKLNETFDKRIVSKIDNPDDLKNAEVGQLYEDLGSGRNRLAISYINYLIENPYAIPFGIGLNNRLIRFSAAHNLYLSLIGEVGLVGFFLYFYWLCSYLLIKMENFPYLELALKGLVISMLVTLFFGEHLYVYRPLFALLGIFMIVTTILTIPLLQFNEDIEGTTT